MLHYQGYMSLISTGSINNNHTSFPVINDYPSLEINVSTQSLITAISPFNSGRILIAVFHSMILLSLFVYFNYMGLPKIISTLAIFIYACNPRYIFFDTLVSYQSIGLCMVILLLLIALKLSLFIPHYKHKSYFITGLFVLAGLIITHHLSSFVFIFYGIILFFVNHFVATTIKSKKLDGFVALSIVLFFCWLIYITNNSIEYLYLGLNERIISILQLSVLGGTGERNLFVGSPVPQYETFIVRYLYPPILLIFCVISGYILIKEKLCTNLQLILYVYGPILFLISWPFVLVPWGQELAYRLWSFFWIGLSFYIATVFQYFWEKRILYRIMLVFAMIVIFFSGVSLGRNEAGRFPIQKKFITEDAFITLDLFYSQNFINEKSGKGKIIAGTHAVKDVFGNYGGQHVDTQMGKLLLTTSTFDESALFYLKSVDWLIIDERVTKIKYSHPLGYFSERSENEDFEYGYLSTLPSIYINKFKEGNSVQFVYTNGNINICKS